MDKEAALLMPYYLIQGMIAVAVGSFLCVIPGLEGFFGVPQLLVVGTALILLTLFLTNQTREIEKAGRDDRSFFAEK